ncbi:TPA: 3-phosphoshikimate 1-carboxyvinyltransferase [Candidatus Bathyarchaeota archaeon]|nr:3-phosphoshikimate 1-carboxyvinyltransferase [Candidatus Bathyarchaeota archaeon]HIJ07791.1 3-phosphoshikimate 1-carboxyvinyltransferase [Candidatus Bathyarchaeota archaeon]
MIDVIVKKTEILDGEVCAPPSKSYTQRMLIASSLSSGTSRISDPLISDDTEATLRAVKAIGAKVDAEKGCWIVKGTSPKGASEPIDCGESGATLRFMIPVAALAAEPSIFLMGSSLEQRPIEPLLQSLKQIGVETAVNKTEGKSSITVQGGGIAGGKTSIRGDISSQFISGLMFACPLAREDTEIAITTPLESRSYVRITHQILTKHGVKINSSKDYKKIIIPSDQEYKKVDDIVPGDFSSAAFLLSAAAITNSNVTIANLDYSLAQGDKAIIGILKKMGAKGKVCKNKVEIKGDGNLLEATDFSAKDAPDLVPPCTVLACFAKGTTTISGAKRLRLKESDRLDSLTIELKKMGADIIANEDGLTVKGPCKLHGSDIDPHNDHRIAMACAVAALGAEGETIIRNAECVKKSYPRFFNDLNTVGANLVDRKFDR